MLPSAPRRVSSASTVSICKGCQQALLIHAPYGVSRLFWSALQPCSTSHIHPRMCVTHATWTLQATITAFAQHRSASAYVHARAQPDLESMGVKCIQHAPLSAPVSNSQQHSQHTRSPHRGDQVRSRYKRKSTTIDMSWANLDTRRVAKRHTSQPVHIVSSAATS